jgi:EpsI family protein
MITAAGIGLAALLAWQAVPDRNAGQVARDNFAALPAHAGRLGTGRTGAAAGGQCRPKSLAADDYHSVMPARAATEPQVGLFMAWYAGSEPGRCAQPRDLPARGGMGNRLAGTLRHRRGYRLATPFDINRAIIQQGDVRMMVYYWFQQGERRVAWDFAAKYYLMVDGITTGSTDGALVRLTTLITPRKRAAAEARLQDLLVAMMPQLPRFIPGIPRPDPLSACAPASPGMPCRASRGAGGPSRPTRRAIRPPAHRHPSPAASRAPPRRSRAQASGDRRLDHRVAGGDAQDVARLFLQVVIGQGIGLDHLAQHGAEHPPGGGGAGFAVQHLDRDAPLILPPAMLAR